MVFIGRIDPQSSFFSAVIIIRIVGYTHVSIKRLFAGPRYARRGRFIYYIYIN